MQKVYLKILKPVISVLQMNELFWIKLLRLILSASLIKVQAQNQNRRNRSLQQTNLHYALSDCQEQFNDLKSELKLRKHCERDNLKVS